MKERKRKKVESDDILNGKRELKVCNKCN